MKKEKKIQKLNGDIQKSLIESFPKAAAELSALDFKSKEILSNYKTKELNEKIEEIMEESECSQKDAIEKIIELYNSDDIKKV